MSNLIIAVHAKQIAINIRSGVDKPENLNGPGLQDIQLLAIIIFISMVANPWLLVSSTGVTILVTILVTDACNETIYFCSKQGVPPPPPSPPPTPLEYKTKHGNKCRSMGYLE